MRLIDADALIDKYQREIGVDLYRYNVIQDLVDAPTVDAVPVRHGRWIKLDMHAHLADHKCTACGQECYVPTCMGEPMYTYCPHCGARMDEGGWMKNVDNGLRISQFEGKGEKNES